MKKTLDIKKLAIKKLSITDLTKITGGTTILLRATSTPVAGTDPLG